jgi:hypothetical protein
MVLFLGGTSTYYWTGMAQFATIDSFFEILGEGLRDQSVI